MGEEPEEHLTYHQQTLENRENVLPISINNFRKKLENDEKYDWVAINYLKEKILNDVKQQFSLGNQGENKYKISEKL